MTTTLYQAGAGTGKTHTITDELGKRLAAGMPPHAILATTFTRKAAAELADRIRQHILSPEPGDPTLSPQQQVQVATSLDAALIGTVHSIGFQLMSRYALRVGLSPRLRPLEEAAQETHLRNVLAQMPGAPWERLAALGRRLGQRDEQKAVLRLLELKRTNRIEASAFAAQMKQGAQRYIEIIAPRGPDPRAPTWDQFYDAVDDAAEAIRGVTDATKKTQDCLADLDRMSRRRRQEWSDWSRAAGFEAGRRSGADALLNDLRALTAGVLRHPDFHDDIRLFVSLCAEQTLALEAAYLSYKDDHGLLDFTDQEDWFLRLLETEDVRNDLAKSLQLVVVDEFQDTNPVQLAIFENLRQLAREAIWVGDEKQAIYGFRGADARLMTDVLGTVPRANQKKLPMNWRSRPGLVQLVNRVFEPFMPGCSLEPAKKDGALVNPGPSDVRRWILSGRKNEEKYGQLVAGILKLREQGTRAGDVAILALSNGQVQDIGAALRRQKIPVVVRDPGLLATREGILAVSGLRYVADNRDHLAIAQIRHITENQDGVPAWVAARAADLDADTSSWADGDAFRRLRTIPSRASPPSAVVADVLQALRLPLLVAKWGEPGRRAANLDAILDLARRYEEETLQEGKAATVTGLIAWLEALEAARKDLLPVPAGLDAITVSTIHGAKGLEWPTVILYWGSRGRGPNCWGDHVSGGDAAHRKPLEGRTIRYWPYPFGTDDGGNPINDGVGIGAIFEASPEGRDAEERHRLERRRLLYVALTRAKHRLILAHSSSDANPEPAPFADLRFAHHLPIDADGEEILSGDAHYSVEEFDPAPAPGADRQVVWFREDGERGSFPLRHHSPSIAPALEGATATAEALPGEHPFVKLRDVEWEKLGDAVHAFLASLPALEGLGEKARVGHAAAILARWGVTQVRPEQLVAAGQRLEEYAEKRWPGATWNVEVPFASPRAEGGQWRGKIDLIIDAGDHAAIVDHKSADYSATGWETKALEHSGQVAVYAKAVNELQGAVVLRFIHLPLGGGVARLA